MVRVKICGITNLEDALLAEQLGADALGFIFTKKSPRYIKPALAKKIIAKLGPFVSKAGVFMNQEKEEVLDIASLVGLDLLQFHGKETVSYCNQFMPQFKVVKVCFPNDSVKTVLRYQNLDALMFDIPYKEKQEQKKTLPKDLMKFVKAQIKKNKKVILSGGLDPTNIKSVAKLHPYGVDAASGIEELVGKKNKKAMQNFIERVKNASS
ncbi:MAG: phosphoribosylanthranilate isomerase [Candidatus Omnitrophica bacterium]|nr:phosphoribosylanthranilate isomerase [Candidatus Omnitrophota bacterium]MCF7895008.1 phosphoribosylanthranilate isomerase [Candidatus Omnitrophota bacterium]